jgi:hypothetical protein
MTEKRAEYKSGASPGTLPSATLLRFSHPEYEHPTPADVRTLKDISGLTGKELCEMAGVLDARTWRRWSQESDKAGARPIPYSTWRLLLLELGIVDY